MQELIIRDQGLIIPIFKGEEYKEDQDHVLHLCYNILKTTTIIIKTLFFIFAC